MQKREKFDLAVLLAYPIAASLLCLALKAGTFTSILVFFGIPSLYLSFRAKKFISRSLVFSLVIGLPLMFVIDYIAHITRTWLIPFSIINFRFLGYVTIEVLVWAVLYCYYIVMFYEYFLDRHVSIPKYGKNMRLLVLFVLLLLALFFSVFLISPAYLNIPYFYLVFGLVLVLLPILLVLLNFPRLFSKLLKATAYFFFPDIPL